MSVLFPLIAKAIPDGLALRVLRGPARGSFWYPGAAPGPSKGLSILFNRSEPAQLRAAQELARGAQCCFDIGAHSGLYSLVFARQARRVCAFEPLPRNIFWLERTLERNGVKNITLLPWAVSGRTGLSSFEEGPHSSMGRLALGAGLPVSTVTLRDFIAQFDLRPDVMKIDVEGAEGDVLRGGLEYLRERRPAILLSIHSPELRAECLGLLREVGYSRFAPLDAARFDDAEEYRIEA
jgi:FkbM family methyltransferase